MMIKTTVEHVVASASGGEDSSLNRLVNSTIPATTAWNVREIAEQAARVIGRYEKIRESLLEKYATVDEKAGVFKFETPEAAQEFEGKLRELLGHEIEIKADRVSLSELKHTSLSALNISQLGYLLDGVSSDHDPLDGFEL